ncbi:MAG: sulfotransferase, partial [Parasphingorhabdus sp.]
KLAAFCGIACDAALADMAVERTSRAYMLEHKNRFDDAMMRQMSEERAGLTGGGDSAKIRATSAPRKVLPPEIAERMETEWKTRVAPVTGHADFASLEAELTSRLNDR